MNMPARSAILQQGSESSLLIVNYHYIRDPSDYKYPGIHPISRQAFRSQVEMLKSEYHAATPAEVEAFARGERVFDRRPAVFLTFDDGLVDHFFAAELLNDMGMYGAFFLSSQPLIEHRPVSVHKVHWLRASMPSDAYREEFLSHLGDEGFQINDDVRKKAEQTYIYDKPGDAELKYLMNFILPIETVDEITSLMLATRRISEAEFCSSFYIMQKNDLASIAAAGHVIGCHGHSHRPFATLTEQQLASDVNQSISCLADICGASPKWVSYPFGSPTAVPQDTDLFCRQFGFDVGLTLKRGWNQPGQAGSRLNRINTNELRL